MASELPINTTLQFQSPKDTRLGVSSFKLALTLYILKSLIVPLPASADDASNNGYIVVGGIVPVITAKIAIQHLPQVDEYSALTYGRLGNSIEVNQDGSQLSINAIQQGNHNYSHIDQSGINDDVKGVDSTQIGIANVQLVTQSGLDANPLGGTGLDAAIEQNGRDNGLWLSQSGDYLTADVEQFSNDNRAYVEQSGYGHSMDIIQRGNGNIAGGFQTGFDHLLYIEQIGNNNTALAMQSGAGAHHAIIYQDGNHNTAFVIQASDSPMSTANISQVGDGMSVLMMRILN